MATQRFSPALALILASGLLAGCLSTKTITKRSELLSLSRDARVKVLCPGDTVYDLKNVRLIDSVILGEGTATINGNVREFAGGINLSSIQYMQSSRGDAFKTIIAVGAVGFVGLTAAAYLGYSDNTPFSAGASVTWYDPRAKSSSGSGGRGSSCPYVYSWDGMRYVLDGEAYSVAWGKALEMETTTMLPSLQPANGEVRVRLTNERPETHYYSALSLVAVESDESAAVVPDVYGGLWQVHRIEPPLKATDGGRLDVLDRLGAVHPDPADQPPALPGRRHHVRAAPGRGLAFHGDDPGEGQERGWPLAGC